MNKLRTSLPHLAASLANPILVRELRQTVRNRVILYGLQFYLLALVLAFFYAVFTHSIFAGSDMELGSKLFPILLNLTFYTTLASVLIYGAGRLVFERVNDDLMFYSTISPAGFVLGKMTCGLAISMMFYSVSFPFFTLIYLLRGVEITTLLLATAYSFCAVQLFLLMALVFFAGVNSWISAVVRLVAFLVCGGGLFFFTAMVFYDLILREQYQQGDAIWALIILSAAKFLLLPTLLFFLASCQFAPVEANRMWAFRITATVILLPSFVIGLFNFFPSPGLSSIGIWIILVFYPFIFFCFLAMHERERYGFRLRRNIPRSFLGRLAAFPFYTGNYNALAWLSCWFLLLIVAVPIYEWMVPGSRWNNLKTLQVAFSAALLTYGYVSFTLYLWSKLLYRWVSKPWIGSITFALLLLAFVGNYTAVYFTDSLGLVEFTQVLHVFFLIVPNYLWVLPGPSDGSEWSVQLYFSLGVFALFFAVNLRETVRMFKTFQRAEPQS